MKTVMQDHRLRFRPGVMPQMAGRMEQSDARALAELTPLALLREYRERVSMSEACLGNARCTDADRENYVQLALRAEREVLNRLGSIYKLNRAAK